MGVLADDHDVERINPPRSLTDEEQAIVDKILSWHETPDELRAAALDLVVVEICRTCFALGFAATGTDPLRDASGAPRWGVAPAELVTGESGGRTHVLLHITDGRVSELQVYRDDGEPVAEMPEAAIMTLRPT